MFYELEQFIYSNNVYIAVISTKLFSLIQMIMLLKYVCN